MNNQRNIYPNQNYQMNNQQNMFPNLGYQMTLQQYPNQGNYIQSNFIQRPQQYYQIPGQRQYIGNQFYYNNNGNNGY